MSANQGRVNESERELSSVISNKKPKRWWCKGWYSWHLHVSLKIEEKSLYCCKRNWRRLFLTVCHRSWTCRMVSLETFRSVLKEEKMWSLKRFSTSFTHLMILYSISSTHGCYILRNYFPVFKRGLKKGKCNVELIADLLGIGKLVCFNMCFRKNFPSSWAPIGINEVNCVLLDLS